MYDDNDDLNLEEALDKLEDVELALSAYRFLAMLGWAALIALATYEFFGK